MVPGHSLFSITFTGFRPVWWEIPFRITVPWRLTQHGKNFATDIHGRMKDLKGPGTDNTYLSLKIDLSPGLD